MKRKLIARRVSAAALATVVATSPMTAFASDIAGHWAEGVMTSWQQQGLIAGFDDGTLRPNATVTRAQFVRMVNQALGFSAMSTVSFSDVAGDAWYANDVNIAVTAGYANGANGAFAPNNNVTREQAAQFVYAATGVAPGSISSFTDAASISSWAQGAVGAMASAGYLSGRTNGAFDPKASMTRAEAVSFLDRVMNGGVTTTTPDSAKENVTIVNSGEVLQDEVINGDLTISAAVGDGEVYLDNVTVNGDMYIKGGGSDSVYAKNVTVTGTVYVEKSAVRLEVSEDTSMPRVEFVTYGTIEGTSDFSGTIGTVTFNTAISKSYKTTLDVDVSSVVINVPVSVAIEGAANTVTVSEDAGGAVVSLGSAAAVGTMTTNAATSITGTGSIESLNVNTTGTTIGTSLDVESTTLSSGVTTGTTSGGSSGGSSSGSSSSSGGGGTNSGSGSTDDDSEATTTYFYVHGGFADNGAESYGDGEFEGTGYQTVKAAIEAAEGSANYEIIVLDPETSVTASEMSIMTIVDTTTAEFKGSGTLTITIQTGVTLPALTLTASSTGNVVIEGAALMNPLIFIGGTNSDLTVTAPSTAAITVTAAGAVEVTGTVTGAVTVENAGSVTVGADVDSVEVTGTVATVTAAGGDVVVAETAVVDTVAGKVATLTTSANVAISATTTEVKVEAAVAVEVTGTGTVGTVTVTATPVTVGDVTTTATVSGTGTVATVVAEENVTIANTNVDTVKVDTEDVTITVAEDTEVKVETSVSVAVDGDGTVESVHVTGDAEQDVVLTIDTAGNGDDVPKITQDPDVTGEVSGKVGDTDIEESDISVKFSKPSMTSGTEITVGEDITLEFAAPSTDGAVYMLKGEFTATTDFVTVTEVEEGKDQIKLTSDKVTAVGANTKNTKILAADAGKYSFIIAQSNLTTTDANYNGNLASDIVVYEFTVKEADKTGLKAAIATATTAANAITVDTAAENVLTGTKWILAADKTTYVEAIAVAQGVVDDKDSTATVVATAVTTLATATTAFEAAQKDGTKTDTTGDDTTTAPAATTTGTITGEAGTALTQGVDIEITLANDTFVTAIAEGQDVTSAWITDANGLTFTVKTAAAEEGTTITLTATGTPTAKKDGAVAITIPDTVLDGAKALTVTGATWAITEAEVKTPSAAAVGEIAGIEGEIFESGEEITITLTNDTFKAVATTDDVSAWFTNAPTGTTFTVKEAVTNEDGAITITVGGEPEASSTDAIAIAIPNTSLNITDDGTLTATGATWAIKAAVNDVNLENTEGTAYAMDGDTLTATATATDGDNKTENLEDVTYTWYYSEVEGNAPATTTLNDATTNWAPITDADTDEYTVDTDTTYTKATYIMVSVEGAAKEEIFSNTMAIVEENTAAIETVTVAGDGEVGTALTATAKDTDGNVVTGAEFQWYVSDDGGTGWAKVSANGTDASYTPVKADIGKFIMAIVTNDETDTEATVNKEDATSYGITSTEKVEVVNTAALTTATITSDETGVYAVGKVLTPSAENANGEVTDEVTYTWYVSDTGTAANVDSGWTALASDGGVDTYTIVADNIGKYITVVASNAANTVKNTLVTDVDGVNATAVQVENTEAITKVDVTSSTPAEKGEATYETDSVLTPLASGANGVVTDATYTWYSRTTGAEDGDWTLLTNDTGANTYTIVAADAGFDIVAVATNDKAKEEISGMTSSEGTGGTVIIGIAAEAVAVPAEEVVTNIASVGVTITTNTVGTVTTDIDLTDVLTAAAVKTDEGDITDVTYQWYYTTNAAPESVGFADTEKIEDAADGWVAIATNGDTAAYIVADPAAAGTFLKVIATVGEETKSSDVLVVADYGLTDNALPTSPVDNVTTDGITVSVTGGALGGSLTIKTDVALADGDVAVAKVENENGAITLTISGKATQAVTNAIIEAAIGTAGLTDLTITLSNAKGEAATLAITESNTAGSGTILTKADFENVATVPTVEDGEDDE